LWLKQTRVYFHLGKSIVYGGFSTFAHQNASMRRSVYLNMIMFYVALDLSENSIAVTYETSGASSIPSLAHAELSIDYTTFCEAESTQKI